MSACGFEKEIALALREGRWPAAVDPTLRDHVATCTGCSEVVLVSQTLQHARAAASRAAVLPPPGIIFWRAQLRRRSGAAERMTRPIVLAEVVALVVTILAFVFAVRRFAEYSTWETLTGGIAPSGWTVNLSDVVAVLPSWAAPVLLAAVVFFALGGVAIYVLAHNE